MAPASLQFTVPDIGHWPVDVMVVDDETFSKLEAEAETIQMGSTAAPVASLMHLVLMKLHAMKGGSAERFAKDLADVLELLRLRGLDPTSAEFQGACEKYATKEIHERITQL